MRNKEKQRQARRRHYWRNRDDICDKRNRRYATDADFKQRRALACKGYSQRLKAELIAAYGGKCTCCGEHRIEFLTLEHIKRDGREHRESVGGQRASYRDLKRRGFPRDGYTILCWNCQEATRYGESCPHQIENERRKSIEVESACSQRAAPSY